MYADSSSPSSGFVQKMHSPSLGPFMYSMRHGAHRRCSATGRQATKAAVAFELKPGVESSIDVPTGPGPLLCPFRKVPPHVARQRSRRERAPLHQDAPRRPRTRPSHLRSRRVADVDLSLRDGDLRGSELAAHSQPRLRKYATRPASTATITPAITQKASVEPSPGTLTFMPQMLAMSVSGSRITETEVSTRSTLFRRCVITDSFVSSSASTTSL